MKLLLKSVGLNTLFFIFLFIHFRIVHYEKILELAGSSSVDSSGYLLGIGPIDGRSSVILFWKINFALFILFLGAQWALLMVKYFRIYYFWIFALACMVTTYIYFHESAHLIFMQEGSTWTTFETLLVGIFGL